MTPEQATDLATRTLAAIDREERYHLVHPYLHVAADRERVARDLAGFLRHATCTVRCEDRPAFLESLCRTADLYGAAE